MPDPAPCLLQLRDCANGMAVRHLERAKDLGFGHMLLSVGEPGGIGAGLDPPAICIAYGIDADVQRQWAAGRFRQDPLHRMKARGELSQFGNGPLLWENRKGNLILSDAKRTITSTEVATMRWVYGYGMRTGVNLRPCAVNGREVSISFYSNSAREDVTSLDDAMAILFYLSHMVAEDLKTELARATLAGGVRLTRRETECLGWVAAGKNAQEIAVILGLSVQTVRDHLKRVRSKLNSTSRAQALIRASALGLLPGYAQC